MDERKKSILIGAVSGCAAVMVIVLLFFSIQGISGNGDSKSKKSDKDNSAQVVSVDSEGNIVVIIDDEDEEEQNPQKETVSSDKEEEKEEEKVDQKSVFGRSDIDGITEGVKTFAQFVKAVSAVRYE